MQTAVPLGQLKRIHARNGSDGCGFPDATRATYLNARFGTPTNPTGEPVALGQRMKPTPTTEKEL